MKKAYLLLVAWVLMLAMTNIPNALCYPPAGSDTFNLSKARVEIEIIDMFKETLWVGGPTTVHRSDPYDPGTGRIKIDTEIVSMSLVGTSDNIGPITIIESPSKKSNGTIQQQTAGIDFPADSFFDVFIEIQTSLGYPLSTLHNDDPVPMSQVIYSIPPGDVIYGSLPGKTPLKDERDITIGFIKHVSHRTIGGFDVPVDKFALLTPYIGSTSAIIVATIAALATAVYVKRVKHRK